jgi:hypothetical protein
LIKRLARILSARDIRRDGAVWNETNVAAIIQVICVLGTMVFCPLTIAAFFWTISKLIYPYGSVESTLITHLNKPENNKGHTEGDKLKPIRWTILLSGKRK